MYFSRRFREGPLGDDEEAIGDWLGDLAQDAAVGVQPIRVRHNRYTTVSADGSLDLAPLQLGAEVAYMWGRTLFRSLPDGQLANPERSDMLHGALKLEWLDSTENLLVVEAFVQHAVHAPTGSDARWFAMDAHRLWKGVSALGRWTPLRRLSLELAAVAFSGPSWLLAPRLQLEALSQLFLELGGFWVGGKKASGMLSASRTSLGAVYDNVDQIFVGLRWLP
jgi:hypothetical protein